MVEPKSKDDQIRSLLKAIAILDCFSTRDQKLSVAEIAEMTRLPRATAHRLVATLKEARLLERERERDHYRLGMKLFEYGTTVLANMDLQREAKPFVESLSKLSRLNVHLCVFDGTRSTFINRSEVDGRTANTTVTMIAAPIYCTAGGKSILAFQPKSVIDRIIGLGLTRYTEHTITDPERLLAELELVRSRGYAEDREEHGLGFRCVGAPIRDLSGRVFAGISVTGPANRFADGIIPEYAVLVRRHAAAISAQLGYASEESDDLPGS
ncbi:MAG: IclR family transcriptional regulator [Dehalococcoidia bacterium]